MKVGEEIRAPKTTGCLQEDGIFYIQHDKDAFIEMDDALAIVARWKEASAGKTYPHLLDFRGLRISQAPEVREYFATTRDLDDCLVATALLVDEIADSMVAKFFVQFNKPVLPTRVFKDEKAAREWLYQFV